MNATTLYLEDGKPAGIYFCAKCRRVHVSQPVAEECCTLLLCCDCGQQPRRPHYMTCEVCAVSRRDRREREKFDKSEKLEAWDGPVYLDGAGSNEGYFGSLEELYDWITDRDSGTEESPAYCWAALEKSFVRVNARSAIENGTADFYDDWDSDGLVGVPEFEAACDLFNEVNKHHTSYAVDYSKSIKLSANPQTT